MYMRYWPCKDEELHLPYIIKCGSVRTNSVILLGVPIDPRNHFSNYKKKCINIYRYYNSGQKIVSELLSEKLLKILRSTNSQVPLLVQYH